MLKWRCVRRARSADNISNVNLDKESWNQIADQHKYDSSLNGQKHLPNCAEPGRGRPLAETECRKRKIGPLQRSNSLCQARGKHSLYQKNNQNFRWQNISGENNISVESNISGKNNISSEQKVSQCLENDNHQKVIITNEIHVNDNHGYGDQRNAIHITDNHRIINHRQENHHGLNNEKNPNNQRNGNQTTKEDRIISRENIFFKDKSIRSNPAIFCRQVIVTDRPKLDSGDEVFCREIDGVPEERGEERGMKGLGEEEEEEEKDNGGDQQVELKRKICDGSCCSLLHGSGSEAEDESRRRKASGGE